MGRSSLARSVVLDLGLGQTESTHDRHGRSHTVGWLGGLFNSTLGCSWTRKRRTGGLGVGRLGRLSRNLVLEWKRRLMVVIQLVCAKHHRYLCSAEESLRRHRIRRLATGLVTWSDDRLMPWPILCSTWYYPTQFRPTISARSTDPSHSHARALRRRLQ